RRRSVWPRKRRSATPRKKRSGAPERKLASGWRSRRKFVVSSKASARKKKRPFAVRWRRRSVRPQKRRSATPRKKHAGAPERKVGSGWRARRRFGPSSEASKNKEMVTVQNRRPVAGTKNRWHCKGKLGLSRSRYRKIGVSYKI